MAAHRAAALAFLAVFPCVALLYSCDGSTGREGLPGITEPGGGDATVDGVSTDAPGDGEGGEDGGSSKDSGAFDVELIYADRLLPDVAPPVESGTVKCPSFVPVLVLDNPDGSPDGSMHPADWVPGAYDDAGNAVPAPPGSPCDNGWWNGDGGLVPCRTRSQVDAGHCVSCQGNAGGPLSNGGACSPTEAAFVQLDIDQGWITAAGPDSNPHANLDGGGTPGTCYECLAGNYCLNSPPIGITGLECGDLPTTPFTAGNGYVGDPNAICLATLACIQATRCAEGKYSNAYYLCYCGDAGGGVISACATTTRGQDGVCLTAETNGFTYVPTNAHDVTGNFGNVSQPSGMANSIFGCAETNGCPQCVK
jgi:hypothetical protein